MNSYTWTGIVLLALGALLLVVARPDSSGEPAKFLRFSSAQVLFPPIVLVFLAFGMAGIIAGLLTRGG